MTLPNIIHEWVIRYHENGFTVVATDNNDPEEPNKPKMTYKHYKDSPQTMQEVEQKVNEGFFDSNFAVMTGIKCHRGKFRGYYAHCLDVDNKETFDKLEQICPSEKLSRDGIFIDKNPDIDYRRHYWFWTKVPVPSLPSGYGMELKTNGMLCNIFPGLNKAGKRYKPVGDSLKLFQDGEDFVLHDDFIHVINKVTDGKYLNGDANKNYNPVLRNNGRIPKGERHSRLLSYANSIIAKLSKTTNRETIFKYLEIYKDTECQEPESFPQSELVQIFNDAWNERVINNNNNNNNNKTENNSQSKQEENNRNDKVLSVLEAKRLQHGKITVLGTIVSVTDMYILEEIGSGVTQYRNAKSIQLEDTEKLDENERYDVILYDKMIDNVRAGETVQISGNIRIEERKESRKSKRKINVLHAESIEYLNRKEILVTDIDIETFEKFASYPQLLDRLTAMFAPNVVGHNDVKVGLLRAIVGGVDRGKKGGGRIDTLELGDPGTAKSKLGAEATELKPNSRHVSGPHATTKTITAIVERINDNTSLSLGSIPLSRGAICAIDEINSFSMEDQSRLLDVLEEGVINIDKMGRSYKVPAPTTIIATANPIGGKWNSDQIATIEEVELKRSLMDRFTQVYAFRDTMDENQTNDFVTEMSDIRKRDRHNYNFLRKYLIHANSIPDVKFTKNAEQILNQFWVKGKVKGLLSIRMYVGLFKIAEAQAKLQLKNIVNDEIASQVIQDVQMMMVQYGETIGEFMGPHELAYTTFLEILKENHPTPMSLESICELAIQKEDKIGTYLGYVWTLRDNWKLRNVVDSLLNIRNVIRTQEKPIVLQFLCDGCDVCEGKNRIKHIDNDSEKSEDSPPDICLQQKITSHSSHTSHTKGKCLFHGEIFGDMISLQ